MPKFVFEDILTCAISSKIAYLDSMESSTLDPFRKDLPPMQDIRFLSEPKTDAQCVCMYQKDQRKIIVAFRGTSSVADVLTDLWVLKERFPFQRHDSKDFYVHKGFLTQYKSLRDQVFGYVKDIQSRFKDTQGILFTGHSLGGALSTLAAADFHMNQTLHVKNINFGSPRLGNHAFCSYVTESVPCLRVTHKEDPVVHVPTPLRWRHAGSTCVIDNDLIDVVPYHLWKLKYVLFPNVSKLNEHDLDHYIHSVQTIPAFRDFFRA